MKRKIYRADPFLPLLILIVPALAALGTEPQKNFASSFVRESQSKRNEAELVSSITRAPIVPDGDVAGAPTELVIDLDISLDPTVSGRTLLQGKTIKIVLPDEFENTGRMPVQDFFTPPSCIPGNLQCNSAILLQGWPQHPILPSVPPGQGSPQYSVTLEGTNTVVITANVNLTPGVPLPGPGIKQIHLILNGFRNPAPGFYDIEVIAETGPHGSIETGIGHIHILPKVKPSLNITSSYNPGSPNTMYQETLTGQWIPLPYDFLLWDRTGGPLEGVTIVMTDPRHGLLVQGERTVGKVFIGTPDGASGQEIYTENPSFSVASPVSGIETARLTAFFRAGSVAGEYVITLQINGGNWVQMFVHAE